MAALNLTLIRLALTKMSAPLSQKHLEWPSENSLLPDCRLSFHWVSELQWQGHLL